MSITFKKTQVSHLVQKPCSDPAQCSHYFHCYQSVLRGWSSVLTSLIQISLASRAATPLKQLCCLWPGPEGSSLVILLDQSDGSLWYCQPPHPLQHWHCLGLETVSLSFLSVSQQGQCPHSPSHPLLLLIYSTPGPLVHLPVHNTDHSFACWSWRSHGPWVSAGLSDISMNKETWCFAKTSQSVLSSQYQNQLFTSHPIQSHSWVSLFDEQLSFIWPSITRWGWVSSCELSYYISILQLFSIRKLYLSQWVIRFTSPSHE